MALRARQEQQQQQQQQQQQLRARCRLASHPRGCVRTEEQMKTSFMPLLYKLMYELSRSVYRATYTTAYLRADACQRLRRACKGLLDSLEACAATPRPPRASKQSLPRPRPLSLRCIADYLHLRSLIHERAQNEPR